MGFFNAKLGGKEVAEGEIGPAVHCRRAQADFQALAVAAGEFLGFCSWLHMAVQYQGAALPLVKFGHGGLEAHYQRRV